MTKMTKMNKFVYENNVNDVKNDVDAFDEAVANGVKTENEEVQCIENDDVFDEALERKIEIDSPGRNSLDTSKCPLNDDVFYGWEQSCHKVDVKNKPILIAKSLYEEETDDVFDEEQEKGVGFNITTGIKLEINEDNDILYENSQESIDLLTNNLKQENDTEHDKERLLMSNMNINKDSFVENKQKNRVELEIEHDRTRHTPLEIEENAEKGSYVTNTNTNFEITQQLDVGGIKKANVQKIFKRKNINVCGTSQKLEKKQNGVKLRETKRDGNTVIFNTNADEEKLEQEVENNNLNGKCVTNKQKLNTGDKQQKEIAKNVEMRSNMGNILEVSTNILNMNAMSKENNLNKIAQLSPKTMSNRADTLKEHAQSDETNLGNRKNGGQLIEKKTPQFAKKMVECDENSEESITNIKQNKTNLKTNIQDHKISLDVSKIDEMLKECAKNLFLTRKRKQKRKKHLLKCGISRSIKTHNLLEVCKRNVNNQFIKKMRKRESRREWKRYLLKCGLKNLKFLDDVKKIKFSTSQIERIYSEEEPQAEVTFQNIQTEKEGVCSEEPIKRNVSNDAQCIGESNSKSKGIDIPDISLELPALELTGNNNILISKEIPQVFNKETETICQNELASFTDPKENEQSTSEKLLNEDKAVKINVSLNSVHSVTNTVVEKPSPKTTSCNNIEYSCTECPFKVKSRANFKIHLMQHGPNFSSGIISFLDLAQNKTLPANQFGANNKHTLNINEKVRETNKQCTREIPNGMRSEGGKSENGDGANESFQTCENDRCIESADSNQQQSEMPNVENNTIREQPDPIVTNDDAILENSENQSTEEQQIQKEREEIFLCDKNDANIRNVDTNSENFKNLKMDRNPLQILTPNEVILESGSKKKRKTVRSNNLRPKKIKLEIKNDKIYCCDQCSYQSHNRKYFNNHIIIHSKDVIKCNLCDFITNHHRNMNNHMLVHLKPEEIKMHKCPYCPYQTKRRSDLHNHLVLHKKPEERRMFQCDKCPYQSKRKCNLRVHQVGHKSDDDAPLFSCAICSYTTKKKCSLKTHMIVHKKVEETCWYKCEQCPYTTKYKSGLKRHGLVHKERDEIKTFDCTVCLYRAKCKSHLKSHLLIHKDPKEVMIHNCDYCSYKAIQKSNLLTHMLKHKNAKEKNWIKCTDCPYKTKLKNNLLKHVNRIHK